jgi:hypothetical protein
MGLYGSTTRVRIPNGNRPDLETQLRARNSCRIGCGSKMAMRPVQVSVWQLTDQELDEFGCQT